MDSTYLAFLDTLGIQDWTALLNTALQTNRGPVWDGTGATLPVALETGVNYFNQQSMDIALLPAAMFPSMFPAASQNGQFHNHHGAYSSMVPWYSPAGSMQHAIDIYFFDYLPVGHGMLVNRQGANLMYAPGTPQSNGRPMGVGSMNRVPFLGVPQAWAYFGVTGDRSILPRRTQSAPSVPHPNSEQPAPTSAPPVAETLVCECGRAVTALGGTQVTVARGCWLYLNRRCGD